MTMFFLAQIALLVVGISLVVRVWKASALDGLLCLIVPLYVLVPMIKHWKDAQNDIRYHVLALFVLAGVSVWLRYDIAHQIVANTPRAQTAEQIAQQVADGRGSDADTADEIMAREVAAADDEQSSADGRPQASIEVGSHRKARAVDPYASAASPPPSAAGSREPDSPVRAPLPGETAPGAPPTARQVIATATFQRGTFERSSLGLAIDLPKHFHALAAGDVRRIESALAQPTDSHEIAWVLHESVPLDAASGWHVQVRWHSDGWVSAGTLDAVQLLEQAQHGKPSPRLAGSGGALIGYAVAPSMSGGAVADWVEERIPAGATNSVLDCHALRLGRKGVVEFSVVGAPAGAQQLCDASVRLLARSTRFDAGGDYISSGADAARAPYTLPGLISGAP